MSKRMKFLVALGLATVIVAAGFAVPIMAADTPVTGAVAPAAPKNDLMDKTAAILGITTDTLTNAFKQVQDEMKSAVPTADDYHTRIAKILSISVDTLMNAEKQAREAAMSIVPSPTEGARDVRPTPPDMSAAVAKILGISTETLTAAEKQARTEMEAAMKAARPAAPAGDEMLSKVAQVLGITTDKLTAAMQQASKEISETRLTTELANAVTNNTITQDEANQIKDWLAKKPVALDKVPGIAGFGGMMGPGGRGMRSEMVPGFGPGNEMGMGRGPQPGGTRERPAGTPSASSKTK